MQVSLEELKELVGSRQESACSGSALGGSTTKIVVCQRGFVYVGKVTKVDNYIVIGGASNVRRWGTNKGLGELANDGVKPETILDPAGIVRVHELAVVALIDCSDSRWQ